MAVIKNKCNKMIRNFLKDDVRACARLCAGPPGTRVQARPERAVRNAM